MSNAPSARWHGDNYQARMFWEQAFGLLRPASPIKCVTFEADGPKAFDDVVVHYEPPVARSAAQRMSADHMQIKWHVAAGGRFGFADLVDPAFIGATSVSLLKRLMAASQSQGEGACFTLVTTDRIRDGDPLADLLTNNDMVLSLHRLFEGKTDASRFGLVRAAWRDHLGLASDEALKPILQNFRIREGAPSLEILKSSVILSAAAAGVTLDETTSDFRPDELARRLKVRGLNRLDRASLLSFLREESLSVRPAPADEGFHPIAIRSFLSASADILDASPDDTLLLTDMFKNRYLKPEFEWPRDVRPRIVDFLRSRVKTAPRLRLVIDGHASMAWLAGQVYDVKSGVTIELVQKGRPRPRRWNAEDGSTGPSFSLDTQQVGAGEALALGISVAQPVGPAMDRFVRAKLPEVGRILHFTPPDGTGHQAVTGGAHAVSLAEQIAREIRAAKGENVRAPVHIFAACPNALLFYLGQNHQTYAPSTMYEYDFDGDGNQSYLPTF